MLSLPQRFAVGGAHSNRLASLPGVGLQYLLVGNLALIGVCGLNFDGISKEHSGFQNYALSV